MATDVQPIRQRERQPPHPAHPTHMRKETNVIMAQLHPAHPSVTPSQPRSVIRITVCVALAAAILSFSPRAPQAQAARMTLTVGAKGFAENDIVANMYVLLLQHAHIPVNSQIKDNLASSVATPALRHGDIDIFPEYTGTGLEVILGQKAPHNTLSYYDKVAAGYRARYNLMWLHPYPMNDTQGFATTQAFAKQTGIYSIADMVAKASRVRLIVATEYLGRADGFPDLEKVYGRFKSRLKGIVLLQGVGSVRYAALLQGRGDVTAAFTTDPDIAAHHLVVLNDPKHYGPPDNLAPVVRNQALQAYPTLRATLNQIASKITNPVITSLSNQVVTGHKDPRAVAQRFLQQQGFLK